MLQDFSCSLQGPTADTYTCEPLWQIISSIYEKCMLANLVGSTRTASPSVQAKLYSPQRKNERDIFCPWVSDRQTSRRGDVSSLRKEVRQLWAFTLHTKQVVSNGIGERRMLLLPSLEWVQTADSRIRQTLAAFSLYDKIINVWHAYSTMGSCDKWSHCLKQSLAKSTRAPDHQRELVSFKHFQSMFTIAYRWVRWILNPYVGHILYPK